MVVHADCYSSGLLCKIVAFSSWFARMPGVSDFNIVINQEILYGKKEESALYKALVFAFQVRK
jgi:hypothetical protein